MGVGSDRTAWVGGRAKEEGVDEDKLEDADDADDVKAAVIALILERVKESSASEARREEELKLRATRVRSGLERSFGCSRAKGAFTADALPAFAQP